VSATLAFPGSTAADVDAMDGTLMASGYLDGFFGRPRKSRACRSYTHGYASGGSDRAGVATPRQRRLAREYARRGAPQ